MAGIKRLALAEADRRLAATKLGEIADLGVDVFCRCNRCGHTGLLASRHLIPVLGPATPVPEVGARVRCSRCDARDVATRPAWPGLNENPGQTPDRAAVEGAIPGTMRLVLERN
ncbi:MAG: hypothetical protein D6826_10665 [Alphaproteobacteria bacterium]|nr:MAG: hypothetical protein D6826_10665 [Alphaproteobacteria bacterium]